MTIMPGYTMIAPVCETGELLIYRATRTLDDLPVLLKVPAVPGMSPRIVSRLEYEYELCRNLDPARIIRPIALEHHNSKVALVMEQGPTKTLASLIDSPMAIQSFLHIAIGINAALIELHRHEIVHKDLKPEHVLLDEDGHVWLTGLGIASRVPREYQPPEPPEAIAGTLAYMAPEQTGRMNHSIDSRSDLYTLGINFFQMLTGVLPFTASDPMEWVHCHVARQPVPPSKHVKNIPDPLSEIVLKLLTKTAEERYQSAVGLETDLCQCLAEWESDGCIAPFSLGVHDMSDQLLIPEKLYGRNSETATMLSAFDRVVAGGDIELVLVTGYSGIGKTSVVYEIHKALVHPRSLFAAGKFDQYKRDIPYATLIQALQALIRYILVKNEAEIGPWRDALQKALGSNGQLIINLIPETELIIGEQPPVQKLPPQEAQNRFRMVLLRFICVFADPEHPVILFLDDLQWLDSATLDLLTHLTAEPEVQGLLLIGAYRDNEVTPTHPLMRTIEKIRQSGSRVQDIVLAPLPINDVCCLVVDSLHCEQERALPLARLLHEKTGGNPFFTIQFLTALVDEKLLTFDRDAKRWIWDLTSIQARNYTDNVVNFMTEKLNKLPEPTQEVLKQFACLGNVAEINTLAMILGENEEEVHTTLWQAVLSGFVFRQDSTYKFLHDRIRQAAYAFFPEDERPAQHLHIGRLLLSNTSDERLTSNVYEIVGHLNRGSALITGQEERDRLVELNLLAGKRAKLATAYASALTYFISGGSLLTVDMWDRRYKLTFSLEFNQAVCKFLTGNMEEAEDQLSLLRNRTHNLIDASAVACQRIEVNTTQSQIQRAVEIGLEYLRCIDVKWTLHPSDNEVRQEFQRLLQQLGNRQVEDLIDLPSAEPDQRAVMDVLTTLDTAALFFDKNLLALMMARIANLSLEHGNSDGSCLGYVWLHYFLMQLFNEYELGYHFGKLACDLVEKRGLVRYKPRVYQAFSWIISPWTHHINDCREMVRNSFATAQEIGQIPSTFAAQFIDVSIGLYTGDSLIDLQPDVETGLELAHKAGFDIYVIHFTGKLRLIQSLRGFTDTEFDEEQFETFIEADPQRANGAFWYWVHKLQSLSYADNYTATMAAAAKVDQLFHMQSGIIEVAEYHMHSALALAVLYDTVTKDEQIQYLESIEAHQQQLTTGARHSPANFENRAALVAAEIARIKGRDMEAMRLYDKAIRSAHDNKFVQQEALAAEVAARFYMIRGFEKIAHTYLRDAHANYALWGAGGKVQQLEKMHPWLPQSQPSQTVTLTAQLDAISVAKAQRAISGEIHLDRLVQTLLRIVMENAGAQTGYLCVEGAGQLRAEIQPDDNGGQHIVFETSPRTTNIPEAIINYVRRSRKTVILTNAHTDAGEFSVDDYLRRVKPKSVFGMAIQRQKKLLAVLYLENNLVSGAFTPELRIVLEVLAAQAAISLETSVIYKALQESEAQYRSLIQKVPTAIVLYDSRGQILDSNLLAQNLLGLTEDQLFGKTLIDPEWQFMREDGSIMPVAEYPVSIVLSTRQPLRNNVMGIYRQNQESISWMLVNAEPEYSSKGEISRIIVSFMNITERKRAEEEIAWNLRINQALSSLYVPLVTESTSIEQIADIVLEKSRQLTSSTHGYVGEIDPETRDLIAHTNTKMIRTECKIIEEKLRNISFPQGADGLYNGLWGYALNTREPFYTNVPTKHPASVGIPAGHPVIERFLTVPVLLAGELVGQIALSNSNRPYTDRDINAVTRIANFFALAIQHKRAKEKICQLNQKLEQRVADRTAETAMVNKELDSFAYSVSHDLRAPLRHIDGFLHLLHKRIEPVLNEKSQQYINSILDSTEHMGMLIEGLVSYSQLGRQRLIRADVSLQVMVQEIVHELQPMFEGRVIDWHIHKLPIVTTDPKLIRLVLVNLISNAIKFTRTRAIGDIEIGHHDEQTKSVIYVRDNGVGFDMKYSDKLFCVFQRLHLKEEFEGTGIGLANVRRIINRHGGRVWVEAELDKGATFFLSLRKKEK